MAADVDSLRVALPRQLARRGLRLTGPRRAVLDALAGSRVPLTVAEIHARLGPRRANIVSVYRALHLLVRLGLARATDETREGWRYELHEQFTGHHHHLICQGCGRIEDLHGCVLADQVLEALARSLRRSRQFQLTEHELRLFGLCRACAA
jgi:Fur family ferric uptake transcriptional regulator